MQQSITFQVCAEQHKLAGLLNIVMSSSL